MSPVRSVIAILGGPLLLGFIDSTLSTTLINAIGQGMPADEAAYLAIRNRPAVLAGLIATHGLACALVGYLLAKIAGAYELRHALAAAAVLTVVYTFGVLADDPRLPPLWMRLIVLIITPPALVAGATVSAQARALQTERAAAPRPEEKP